MNEEKTRELLSQAKDNLRHNPQITVRLLRPFTLWLSKWGLKRQANPNFLTVCMLLTVLASMPLIAWGRLYSLIPGLLLIQWFEIFDDADGIVARGTGKLSLYGEQLDYLMHLICHPLAIATYAYAIWQTLPAGEPISFIPLSGGWLVILLAAILCVCEYGIRSFVKLDSITSLKQKAAGTDAPPARLSLSAILVTNLFCFPVFMQLFPLCLIADAIWEGLNISLWVFGVVTCLFVLFYLKECLARLKRYALVKYPKTEE